MIVGTTSADDTPIVGPDRVRNVVQGLLRAAQANGWTDDALSAATGLKAKRIKSYRVEGKEPSLSAALSIAVVLGQKTLNPILALIGYVAEPLDEAQPLKPGEIVAECAKEFAIIAGAAALGRFDHTTQPQVQEAADLLIATVLPISSAGRAA